MSGSVLLDTNIIIGILAKDEAILSRLTETEAVFLPSIALGELYFGAFKSAHPNDNAERIDRLADSTAILYCDGTTALHYGRIKTTLRARGRPIPENDIWIAAIAQQHGLTVVSRDLHFREIENLSVEEW
ncbi:MAG: type II toxin-antitoxin system VapC family toxin [Nitrospira sp.]|nr:type II toxin-antitoxin system VapC family toxin [Nitrospira sp.]